MSAPRIAVRRVDNAPARSVSEHGRVAHTSVPHDEPVGDSTPIDNMGVTDVQLVMADGDLKTVCVRRPARGQIAVIDQISFTCSLETLENLGNCPISSENAQVDQISAFLEQIFGYGITAERPCGTDFYRRSYDLGNFGQVGIGGQNLTFLIHIYGLGAQKALPGWESRLHKFLTTDAVRPKITRVDLAHDDFFGDTVSVDWALEQWKTNGFTWTGQAPNVEQIGNWLAPTGRGRTLTVGTRTSGKFLRVYEKGKKEGSFSSPWTRFEVELKSRDRLIPFDVLLDPSAYLAGTYPCAEQLHHQADRIKTEKKTAEYNYQRMVEICKTQMGNQLRFLKNFLSDADAVLDLVMSDDLLAVPKRLIPITSGINTMPQFFHHKPIDGLTPERIDFTLRI